MKSDEGKRANFSHCPKLETLFVTQAWILLRPLPEAEAGNGAVLKVTCFRYVSFIGSKGDFEELVKKNWKVPIG